MVDDLKVVDLPFLVWWGSMRMEDKQLRKASPDCVVVGWQATNFFKDSGQRKTDFFYHFHRQCTLSQLKSCTSCLAMDLGCHLGFDGLFWYVFFNGWLQIIETFKDNVNLIWDWNKSLDLTWLLIMAEHHFWGKKSIFTSDRFSLQHRKHTAS